MNDDFGKASAGNGAGKGPVTRAELDQLDARRLKPLPVLEFTPSGTITQTIRQMEEARRAIRASSIRSRLDQKDGLAVREFALTGVAGHAKQDFERSR